MGCVKCHSSFFPLQSQLNEKEKQKLKKTSKLLFLSNNGYMGPLRGQILPALVTRRQTKATSAIEATTAIVATSVVLTTDLPAKSADPSVFLVISAVFFFAFWITNFVVPDFISKYLELDIADELKNPNNNAEDPLEDSPVYTQPSKRGFNRTRKR